MWKRDNLKKDLFVLNSTARMVTDVKIRHLAISTTRSKKTSTTSEQKAAAAAERERKVRAERERREKNEKDYQDYRAEMVCFEPVPREASSPAHTRSALESLAF